VSNSQNQSSREIKLTACASLEFIVLDVLGQTRIITEPSNSGSFSSSFFVDEERLMRMDVTSTVRTTFAHSCENELQKDKSSLVEYDS
jgi:hypothetical protein